MFRSIRKLLNSKSGQRPVRSASRLRAFFRNIKHFLLMDRIEKLLAVRKNSISPDSRRLLRTRPGILILEERVVPTIAATASFSPLLLNEGQTTSLVSDSFTDTTATGTHNVTINWGNGVVSSTDSSLDSTHAATVIVTEPASGNPGSFTVPTHTYPQNGTWPISVMITNSGDSTDTTTLTQNANVQNVLATVTSVSVSGPIDENGTVTLTGAFTDPGVLDQHTVLINWGDGNITGPNNAGVHETNGSGTFTYTHQYLDNNVGNTPWPISVQVGDDGGLSSPATTASAAVNNVAPVITSSTLSPTSNLLEGTDQTFLSGTFTDPGTLDTHTVSIDWGDLSGTQNVNLPAGVLSFSNIPHRYADNGTYTVSYTVSDKDGGVAVTPSPGTVTVVNVAPSNLMLTPSLSTINEGDSTALSGSFNDPGTKDTHSVSIDWGDGSPTTTLSLAAGVTNFSGISHTYANNQTGDAPYTVSVMVTDKDGASTSNTTSVTVKNVAPAVVVMGLTESNEATTVTYTGTFTDPGASGDANYTYAWSAVAAAPNGQSITGPSGVISTYTGPGTAVPNFVFTPDDNGTYTVTLTVTDKDGASTSTVKTLTVDDVAPSFTTSPIATQMAVMNLPTTIDLGTFTDPGTLDSPWKVEVDWGGGAFDPASLDYQTFDATSRGGLSLGHTFASSGPQTVEVRVTDKDGMTSVTKSFTVNVSATPSVVYVDSSWHIDADVSPAGLSQGDLVSGTFDGNPVNGTYGVNAFSTIQAAVNAVASAGTVNVLAGTYAENVTINQPLTLAGPNAGVDPTTATPARTAEAILEPGLTSSFNTSSVITVTADNVTIDGLTIQGSIASPAGGQSPGYPLTPGTMVYAAAGISNSTDINTSGPGASTSTTNVLGLKVLNNIIQDFTQYGVEGETSDGTVSTGNTISANLISDLPLNGTDGYYGQGVVIYDNFYAKVTGNTITDVRTGIQTGNNYASAGAFAPSISDNDVSASVKGIYYNLQYDNATPFTISDNTISYGDPSVSPNYNVGFLIQSIEPSVSATITGNNVSGFLYGVELAGNNTSSTVTVQGGTLTGNTYGVWATNNDYLYAANFDTSAILDNVTITGSTKAGIWIDSTSPDSTGSSFNTTNTVTLTIQGGTSISDVPGAGTETAVGVLISGALSKLGNGSLGNTVFTGFGAAGADYVSLTDSAYGNGTTPNAIDGTGASFDGLVAGTANLATHMADVYAVEDKISDYLEVGTGGSGNVGFVRLQDDHIFVTQSSDSIQRGINAAGSGDTVNVQAGTYVGNVVIGKSLSLVGPNAGVDPTGLTMAPSRADEAILEPGATSDFTTSSVITVAASDVSIDGFTIKGSNAGLSGGFPLASGTVVYAAAGISNSANVFTAGTPSNTVNVSGLTVQNNIIQDFTQYGVEGDTSDGTPSVGNTIAANLISNLPDNGSHGGNFYGEGVVIYDNFYARVTGNKMTNVRTGIQTGNNYLSAGAFAPSISGNSVSATVKGIYYNLQYEDATPFTISDNVITNGNPLVSPAYNVGLLVQSIEQTASATITGNDVSGFRYGVEFAGNNTTNTVTVQGGTLSGNTYGVWATNNDYFYPDSSNTSAILDHVTITGSTTAGIWIDSTSPDSTGSPGSVNTTSTVTLTIQDGTSVSGTSTGLLISGSLSKLGGNTLNNTSFTDTSLAGHADYIVLEKTAYGSGPEIDGTGATYGAIVGGGTLTLSDAYTVEGKIVDELDDPTVGYVSLTSHVVYVAASSETANAGAIQRGLTAAGLDPMPPLAGDTVNVEAGTFAGQITISQPVVLLGANAVTDARGIGRATETVIQPTISGAGTASGQIHTVLITVRSSNVAIKGFTLTGQNTALMTPGVALTESADIAQAAEAIAAYVPTTGQDIGAQGGSTNGSVANVGNITIENNVIEDVSYQGVDMGWGTDGTVTTNNVISQNLFQNIGSFNDEGDAVRVYNNFYADVTNNKIVNTRMGVEVGNFYAPNSGTTGSIADNLIDVRRRGVLYNLVYSTSTGLAVTHNTIGAVNDDLALLGSVWTGVYIISQEGTVTASFLNNTIDGTGSNYAVKDGYVVTADDSTAHVTITGGTVSNVTNGVVEGNTDPNGLVGTGATTDMGLTVSGVTISASDTGILISDSSSTVAVSATITGNTTISTGGTGTGVLVSGTHASATVSGDTITNNSTGVRFTSGGSGSVTSNDFIGATSADDNGTDLLLDSAPGAVTLGGNQFAATTNFIDNESTENLDATGDTFDVGASGDQVGGSALTLSEAFTVEGKIIDKLDNASLGYVSITDHVVYVAHSSEVANHGAISRGVGVAVDGDTVDIESGAYTDSNILVSKSITIQGESESGVVISPNGTDSHDDSTYGGVALQGFIVTAPKVTIEDLKIDGGVGLQNYRQGIIADSDHGWITGSTGGLVVDSVTIDNVFRKGIALYNRTAIANSGIQITDNTLDSIGSLPGNSFESSFAIADFASAGTISGNMITKAAIGIGTNFLVIEPTGFSLTVTGNKVSSPATGTGHPAVGLDLSGLGAGSEASLNTVDLTGGGNDIGIVVQYDNDSFLVDHNSVTTDGGDGNLAGTGPFGANDTAIVLYQDFVAASQPTITANILNGTGTDAGVIVTDDGSLFGESPNSGITYATLTSNEITGFGSGIFVTSAGNAVSAKIGDGTTAGVNTIISAVPDILSFGILVSGPHASATIDDNAISGSTTPSPTNTAAIGIDFRAGGSGSVTNTTFSTGTGPTLANNDFDLLLEPDAGAVSLGAGDAFSGNQLFIANTSADNLDATGDTFDVGPSSSQVGGSHLSLDEGYAVEDKILDYLDGTTTDGTTPTGYVTLQSGSVFVAHSSEDLNFPDFPGAPGAVQRGVNAAVAHDVVNIQSGTFVANLVVNQTVELKGAGQGSTIIVPATIGDDVTASDSLSTNASTVILVQANGVTIDNLTVDGNNSALTSGISVGGVDVDARNGIVTDYNQFNSVDGLDVHDTTVQNIYFRGIEVADDSPDDPASYRLEDNTVTNVQGDSNNSIGIFVYGDSGTISGNIISNAVAGIATNHSRGAKISQNTITGAATGIHSDNNGDLGGVNAADQITKNTISAGVSSSSYGILVFVPGLDFTVDSNTVSGVLVGLAAVGGGAGNTVTFSDNTVDLSGTNPSSASAAVYVTPSAGGFGFPASESSLSIVLSGNDLTTAPGAASYGILADTTFDADPSSVATVDLTSATANTINISTGATGLDLKGTGSELASGIAGPTLGQTEFVANIATNTGATYVAFTGNAYGTSVTEVDGTSASFDGTVAGAAGTTTAQEFGIEDHIDDAIDNGSTSKAFVRLKSGEVYVTPSSSESPETAATIQTAIDAASNGDTVNIEGGSYTGNVDTGAKGLTLDAGTSTVNVTGSVTLHTGDTLDIQIASQSVYTNYVLDPATFVLGGATLAASFDSYTPTEGHLFNIVSADAVTPAFAGLASGDKVDSLSQGTAPKYETRISYSTGTVTLNLNFFPVLTDHDADSESGTITDGGTLIASDSFDFNDVDTSNTETASFSQDAAVWNNTHNETLSPAQESALLGGFSIHQTNATSSSGSIGWTYQIDESDISFLGAGESVTLNFTVTVKDNFGASDSKPVTITITGANDQPTLNVTKTSGSVTEGNGTATLTDSSPLSFADLDTNDVVTVSQTSNHDIVWSGGTIDPTLATALVSGFSVSQTGWTYTTSQDLDFLREGETITFSYNVVATDNSGAANAASAPTKVTITIHGTNDQPTLNVTKTSGSVTEGNGTATLTDSSPLSFADLDTNDVVTVSQTSNHDIVWSGGTIDPTLATAASERLLGEPDGLDLHDEPGSGLPA